MKRILLIALTVFPILGGLLLTCLMYSWAVDPSYNVLLPPYCPGILVALGLLVFVGNLYTLYTTRGFTLWNSKLPTRVRGVAIAGWVVGGAMGALTFILLCRLVLFLTSPPIPVSW